MKIIYLTHCEQDTMDYFIKLRETEKIGDADVIVIDGERYKNKTMDPSERVDTEHFISYDYNDLYFRRRGIGGGDNFIHYVLMSEKVLDRIKLFVLDMDGTFYLGENLIPGSLEFLDRVRDTGRDFIFFTNNGF